MATTSTSKFLFFTWRFGDGFNPHSITVLAKNKEKAITKALRCFEAQKIFRLEGPFTRDLETILKTGVSKGYEKPPVSLKEFLQTTEPKVTDSDCLISVSALDG